MTAPIFEPTPARADAKLGYGTDQLQRRPALVAGDVGATPWIVVEGYTELTNGAENTVSWTILWMSDNATGYFDFEVIAGGGPAGEDIAWPQMIQSGVYTFSLSILTSDLDSAQPNFRLHTRTRVLEGGSLAAPVYPAGTDANQTYQAIWPFYITDSTGDDLWVPTSWTIPIQHDDPGVATRTGTTSILYSGTLMGTTFWSVRLYIARHADVSWTPSNFSDGNATWP